MLCIIASGLFFSGTNQVRWWRLELISNGMHDAGYEYIVIDDCWQESRDSLGFIVADPKKFPSGIKALADYIHSKRLKFDITFFNCSNSPKTIHQFENYSGN